MKLLFLALCVAVCPFTVLGQSSIQKTPLPAHPNGPASEEIQTEKIESPGQTPAVKSTQASASGVLEPAQVKALTHKLWLTQFRLNDLLAQIHPEKWKMLPATRQSFGQSLEALHKALASEDEWRNQLEARPDSLYLGFQTYVAISAVLPRVDGVAHSVSQYENASFGAQYGQAGNQLFDLQQQLEPHLAYMLKNQDGLLLAAQTNLASCQNELNFAEHNKQGPATPMKNIAPDFKGRKVTAHSSTAARSARKTASRKTASKPTATSAQKPQTK